MKVEDNIKKVYAINRSPRKNSNTAKMLDKALGKKLLN